jgi:hypothetical protein
MKELKNTVVNVKTQEEYDELMNMYEKAGWKWCDGEKPSEYNGYKHYSETCIDAEDRFCYKSVDSSKKRGEKIISLQEFKNMQEKTFKTLEVGDLIQDDGESYQRVLAVLNRGDENSESIYALSYYSSVKISDNLKKIGIFHTSYELEEGGFTIVKEETKAEPKKMTVAEVAKALGHEVEIVK